MKRALTRCWYERRAAPRFCLLVWLLIPFSWLFRLLVALRRGLYGSALLSTTRLPVAVVVVGNLNVGGSGKTPLTLALVQWLREAGYSPGVVSRGYGGKARAPMPVRPDSDPGVVGDEPVLLARRAGCPVWVGRKRAEAGGQLLAFHPEVDVILTDDGLQHYALARDFEIVVVDGERGFGNGRMLPAGPLREPVSRLSRADAWVVNGGAFDVATTAPKFTMRLAGERFINLADPTRVASSIDFDGHVVHAVAGIGHPQRFFDGLAALGIVIIPHAFDDHHAFVVNDLPEGVIIMTEKDAVKCAGFPRNDIWFLAVDAVVDGGLKTLLLDVLKDRNGSQAA